MDSRSVQDLSQMCFTSFMYVRIVGVSFLASVLQSPTLLGLASELLALQGFYEFAHKCVVCGSGYRPCTHHGMNA